MKKEKRMRMQKRKFRIGQLAKQLQVERFVIRFWEKEFGIKTSRSTGGQRFYDELDLQKFIQIKELLYTRRYTIAGARKQILDETPLEPRNTKIIASQKTTLTEEESEEPKQLAKRINHLTDQIFILKKQLKKLRHLL